MSTRLETGPTQEVPGRKEMEGRGGLEGYGVSQSGGGRLWEKVSIRRTVTGVAGGGPKGSSV